MDIHLSRQSGLHLVRKIKREFPKVRYANCSPRTAQAALKGKFEAFKTTNGFDGTAKNPNRLGEVDKGPA
jgi:hypothetical protein